MEKVTLTKIKARVDSLRWPKDTAGRKMTIRVPVARPGQTLSDVAELLREKFKIREMETINYIYVLDESQKFIGVISIKDIFKYPPQTKVSRLASKKLVKVGPLTDQEKVAYIALRHNLKAIPVVDSQDHFLGVVPSDRILSILNKEASEDIYRLAGVFRPEFRAISVLEVPIFRSIKYRIPWLLVGLGGGMLAAWIIGFFEKALTENLVLAMFIPIIVYMSNAIGMQAQTIFIRDLAARPKLLFRVYFLRQLAICGFIGIVCAGLLFLVVSLGWVSAYLSFILAISMLASIVAATFFALLIPYLLNKFKTDPALGSGPFATIIQDILSIIIYFSIANWLL